MGNIAVITNKEKKMGVYLHWNGGPNSIVNFLTYAKLVGARDLDSDPAYGFARLTQIIANFFGEDLVCSVGVNTIDNFDVDNGDNGLYIVNKNWLIDSREFVPKFVSETAEEVKNHYLSYIDVKMIQYIDSQMPSDGWCKMMIRSLKTKEDVIKKAWGEDFLKTLDI